MSRGAAWAAVLLSMLVATTLALWPQQREPRRPAYAFSVCIARGVQPTSSSPSGLLPAVSRALSTEERAALENALSASAAQREARVNPMLDDLEGGNPDAPLATWFEHAPAFTRTARAATRSETCARDGFCVRASWDGHCAPGWHLPTSKDDDDRARFLLWPWGHALRFRATSTTQAEQAGSVLRARSRTSKRIGLVIAADDEESTRGPSFDPLRDAWKRHATLRMIAQHEQVSPDELRRKRLDPFIPPQEIVVLPRLETINDDAAFAAEVRATTPALQDTSAAAP